MRKWMLWLIAVLVMITLVVRLGWLTVNRVREERRWYISQLRFKFSAIIDTIANPHHVSMHIVHGNASIEHEQFVNSKLKYSKPAYLLLYHDKQVWLRVENAIRFAKRDSLYLNTDENKVRIYRDRTLIHEQNLETAIHGRPY